MRHFCAASGWHQARPDPQRQRDIADQAKLQQVGGGHGRCGGYRKDYNHRYEDRRYNDFGNYGGCYDRELEQSAASTSASGSGKLGLRLMGVTALAG